MSSKQLKRRRVLMEAVNALRMESLEQRRLLSTDCQVFNGSDLKIFGDDSNTNNHIVLSYSNPNLTVTDSAAGATPACASINMSSISTIEIFGGQTSTSTSTGNDFIDASAAPIRVTIFGQDGADSLFGSAFGDSLVGSSGADSLVGNDNADTIFGDSGNDSIFGGAGEDSLIGGADDDSLYGGDNSDSLFGDSDDLEDTVTTGNDSLVGGLGDDHLFGGPGDDFVGATVSNSEAGNDEMFGGPGDDYVNGGNNNDTVWGDGHETSFSGSGAGRDSIYGGLGIDEIAYEEREDDLYVSIADTLDVNGKVTTWAAISSATQSSNVVTITAPSHGLNNGDIVIIIGVVPDVFNGVYTITSHTTNTFSYSKSGSAGAAKHVGSYAKPEERDYVDPDIENICTGPGDDYAMGNGDENLIKTEDGDDSLRGGVGADSLHGGDGIDWADYGEKTGALRLSLDGVLNDGENGGDEGDELGNSAVTGQGDIENILSGTGGDAITTNSDHNIVIAGEGDDTVTATSGGNDLIWGDGGNDRISSGSGSDTIFGGDGVDSIRGGDGGDSILAEAGNDSVWGEGGLDTIYGGDGADSLSGDDGADSDGQ